MTDPDLALLGRLVGDLERFAADHWGRAPLRRRADGDWSDLLTVADIEEQLLEGARGPTFRLVRAGEVLPRDRSTRPVRLGGEVVTDAADVERISAAVADGATLVLQGLQRTSLRIARLCRALERATSHAVQANAYLTPAGAAGLATHADEHDVLVLQLSGSKHWEVDGLGDVRVAPGDVLYLPAGTRHSATAQEEASLHLTIGLLTTTWGAVVRRLLDDLGDGELQRPLPLGYARPEAATAFRDGLGEVLRTAADALSSLDPGPVVDAEAHRSRTRRRPLFTGQLAAVLGLGAVDLDTVVALRPDQVAHRDDDGDGRIAVVLPDRRIGFPAIGAAAVDVLLKGQPVAVGDLPGIDDESKVVVVRRLVREGVLAVEPG